MTDDISKQLGQFTGDPDILAIEKTIPETPGFVRELREVLALLPQPTPPEIDPVRAADPSQKTSTVLTETGYANSQSLSAPGFGSIPAASVGVELPYVGQANLLLDPLFERTPQSNGLEAPVRAATNLVELSSGMDAYWKPLSRVGTSWGGSDDVAWLFAQENTTGATEGDCVVYVASPRDEQSGFNSARLELWMGASANETVRCAVSSVNTYPNSNNGQFPWLVGTMRIVGSWRSMYATAKVTLRLVRQSGTGAPVIAAQKEYDLSTFAVDKTYRLDVFYQHTPSDYGSQYQLQLVSEVVASSSGGASAGFEFGDPQLHSALGPQPVDFAPKLGTYHPFLVHRVYAYSDDILAAGFTDQGLIETGWGGIYELWASGSQRWSSVVTGGSTGFITKTHSLAQYAYTDNHYLANTRGISYEPAGNDRVHVTFKDGVEVYFGPVYTAATSSLPDSGSMRILSTRYDGTHFFVNQYAANVLSYGNQRDVKALHHAAADLRSGKGVYRIDGGNHANILRTWRWLDDYGWWWPIYNAGTTQDQAPGLEGQQILASGGSGQSYSTSTPVTGDPKSKSLVANGSGGFATGSQIVLPTAASFGGFVVSAWIWWDAYADDDDLLMQFVTDHASYPRSYSVNLNHSAGGISLINKEEAGANPYRETRYARSVLTAAAWHHVLIYFAYMSFPELWVDAVKATPSGQYSGGSFSGSVVGNTHIYLFRNAAGGQLGAGKIAHLAVVPFLSFKYEWGELPRMLAQLGAAPVQAPIHLNGRLVNIAEQDIAVGYDGSNRVNAVDSSYMGTTIGQTDVTYNGDGTVQKVETVIDGHTITITPTYSGGYVTAIAKAVI